MKNNLDIKKDIKKNQINIFDIANYLIEKAHQENQEINNTRLQKLLYYAQAYYLVNNNKQPLFEEPIEAWDYGPVIPDLYFEFRKFVFNKIVKSSKATNNQLSIKQKETLNFVLYKYKNKSTNELSKQIHEEDPWQDRFENFDFTLNRITNDDLYNYFYKKMKKII
ncbi:Panacea domain-containing protein [Candidatus Phytoplasma sp. AldY-WA1]|uniref:Panacea domain-containing protein n=1 Tax=Candidatus Phytoplasma sp. AldY-WA1 TaxID=2852100 RepID=UPI00254B9522|nr:type II toxin-antitoxin system antitoxin SocA domain-containing protein [Candidatus Phytoplasma sp. AldY-WA1]